jgi:hypothetical protein
LILSENGRGWAVIEHSTMNSHDASVRAAFCATHSGYNDSGFFVEWPSQGTPANGMRASPDRFKAAVV